MAGRREPLAMTVLAGAGFVAWWPKGSESRIATLRMMQTDAEWPAVLTPAACEVLRQQGTEVSFSGRAVYAGQHDNGHVFSAAIVTKIGRDTGFDPVKQLGIDYPVAVDNSYAIWKGFNNEYWPAHYFIDARGRIRYHHFGEGDYAKSERVIQQLLGESGEQSVALNTVSVAGTGVEMASDMADVESPETYIGTERAQYFVSPGGAVEDEAHTYSVPANLSLNQWAFLGDWQVGAQDAELVRLGGAIAYRFHARDLHLVLGPAGNGSPVHFRVTVDGHAPGDDHGIDIDAAGNGVVTDQRLYQLVRQHRVVRNHTFETQFLDPGATAYSFTFG